ncbi:MAG: alcohol dehydrogenase catalytic domain-containing protein [Acidimicrobiales bacterium]
MRAWLLDESPGEYRLAEVEEPRAGPGEVRVRVEASSLNHMDLWLARGLPRPELPHVPGADAAGTIESIGSSGGEAGPAWPAVGAQLAAGDRVVVNPAISCRRCQVCLSGQSPYCAAFEIMGEHRAGAHAEMVVVPLENVVPLPEGLTMAQAAAYPLAFLTAWRMLRRARLAAGETLLVVGVGGGVSSAALVLGVAMGATVYATSRDETKRRRAIELGARAAFDSGGDFPVQADVVVENVGPATFARSLKALAKGGRLVTCGATSGPKVDISLPRLFFKQHEIIGSTMGSYSEFEAVTRVVAAGLPVIIDDTYPFASFPEALERLERGDQLGKIVLDHGGAAAAV